MKIPVMAKNHTAFLRWAQQAGLDPSDCEFISGLDSRVQARRFGCIIKVQGWSQNPKYDCDFQAAVSACCERFIYANTE